MFHRTPHLLCTRRQIIADGLWVACGHIISSVASILSLRVLTELLPPAEFGRFSLLLGLATLAVGLSVSPTLQALLHFYPAAKSDSSVHLLRSVATRIAMPHVIATAIAISVIGFAADTWINGASVTAFALILLFFADSVRAFELSLFNAARRQRAAAIVLSADAVMRPLFAIAALHVLDRIAGNALLGYAIASTSVILLLRKTLPPEGRQTPPRQHSGLQHFSAITAPVQMRQYASPLVPLALLGWLTGMGDRYVVAGVLGVGDAGLYAASHALASRPFLLISTVMEMTLRPVFQNAVRVADLSTIRRLTRAWLVSLCGLSACGVAAFVLLTNRISTIALAEDFQYGARFMPAIALGYALHSVSTVYIRFCYIFNSTASVTKIVAVCTATSAIATLPLVYLFGLAGAACAVPLVFAVQLLHARASAHHAQSIWLSHRVNERSS